MSIFLSETNLDTVASGMDLGSGIAIIELYTDPALIFLYTIIIIALTYGS